ncbi:MAG: 23S rRNA (pseudouridine(1915)-N(3))-methyltransferase RlmH [Alphaproteobacteria bacterium]|nr:23S rRNA (pseudouridine(1915)-N(3))-methyltransferase RlmH [Alphaproteobacteria bacterium]
MKITVIATGKPKKGPLLELSDLYQKRLNAYFPTSIIELPQSKSNSAVQIKQQESIVQLAKIPNNSVVIALDERGKQPTTQKLAEKIQTWRDTGSAQLCFIIGGAEGLSDDVRQRADFILSLSALTLPHQMARVVMLEQIYRSATILAGHPYHRE